MIGGSPQSATGMPGPTLWAVFLPGPYATIGGTTRYRR
jgi:hypothetical protein